MKPHRAWLLQGSGQINVPDLLLMLGAFGSTEAPQFDLDGDGRVAVPDLLLMLGAFGSQCTRQPTGATGGVATDPTAAQV